MAPGPKATIMHSKKCSTLLLSPLRVGVPSWRSPNFLTGSIIEYIVEDPEPLTIRHANTWELLSLLVALQINSEFPAPIFSDCESAVNSLLHITDLGYWRKKDHHFLLSVAYQLLNTTPTSITWIKSHPERRARRCNWTQHEWGIYIADLYASLLWTIPYPLTALRLTTKL